MTTRSIFDNRSFLELARQFILANFGDRVEINRKGLRKFGRNESVGTSEVEINALNANEVHVAGNTITHFSSSNGSDTGNILVEGMTISSGVVTFSVQTVTLAGQTKTALTTPLYRVTRVVNQSSALFAGDVYVYQDDTTTNGVPDTASKIHAKVLSAEGQSQKCATAIASNNYFIVTNWYASVNKKTSASADIRVRVREFGQTFLTKSVISLSQSVGPFEMNLEPYLIIPPRSDIAMTAQGSTTSVDVSAGFNGVFADIQT